MKTLSKIFLSAVICLTCLSMLPASAQDYRDMFKKALDARNDGKPEKALPIFEYISANAPDDDPHKSIAATQAKECRKTIASRKPAPVLSLNTRSFHIPPAGTSREILVTSNNPWEVEYVPEWCEVVTKTNNYVLVKFYENATGAGREEQLRIVSGDLNQVVFITQDPMPIMEKEKCRVFFRCIPENVRISILDSHVYNDLSSHSYDLKEGKHKVTFSKFGYKRLDTTFVIKPSQDNTLSVMDITMEPTFGILTPTVSLENTPLISDQMPEIRFYVDGQYVDLTDETRARSFDSDEGIIYSSLYKGGKIPLKPGAYTIKATAPHYQDYEKEIFIREGETMPMDIKLELTAGYLTVHDMGNAEGAAIYDLNSGVLLGTVGEKHKLTVGEHLIAINKPGYDCDNGMLTVDIKENAVVDAKVSMTRTVVCRVSTTNTMETVYVNGEMIEFHPDFHEFLLKEGQKYDLKVTKEGFWPYTETFVVGPEEDTIRRFEGITLKAASPIKIRTNEPGLTISLHRKDSEKDTTNYAAVTLGQNQQEVSLEIPEGKYRILMKRDPAYSTVTNRRAYKGNLNFKGDKEEYFFQTYPQVNFLAIGADLNLSNIYMGGDVIPTYQDLPYMGSAWFGQFRLIAPGLSTCILKASVLNSMKMGAPEEVEKEDKPTMMLGGSALLLNYDFRVGGAFCQYGDVNLLLSYSWYPDVTKHLRFAHFSGHEAFGGVEISSRIKMFNVNIKAGLMYLNGTRNFYKKGLDSYTNDTERLFVRDPFKQTMFTVRAGFSLGSKKANGRNILRVF